MESPDQSHRHEAARNCESRVEYFSHEVLAGRISVPPESIMQVITATDSDSLEKLSAPDVKLELPSQIAGLLGQNN